MTALSAVSGYSDKTIRNIINGTIKVADFVKENKSEIIGIVIAAIDK